MLVSIIIPCFNVDNYITECIESVYGQTYQQIEVICVDNNSSDNTLKTLLKLKESYSDLIILSEIKPGASAARNKGLAHAKGEWIQFLDADDLLLPNKINHQIELLRNKRYSGPFIAAHTFLRNLEGSDSEKAVDFEVWKALFSTNLGNTCANLFKKETLISAGTWNEELKSSQEYDLMFRLVKKFGAPIVDNKPLTIIRERENGQISQGKHLDRLLIYFQLRYDILVYLKLNEPQYLSKNRNVFGGKIIMILERIKMYDKKVALKLLRLYLNEFGLGSNIVDFLKISRLVIS